jgi:hypothetical protein
VTRQGARGVYQRPRDPNQPTMRLTRLLPAALLLAGACGQNELLVRETPYIQGTITATDARSVRVETPGPRLPGREDKAVVFFGASPDIRWRDGRSASRADLVPGKVVSVWITGPVRESYPVQVDATVIVVE